MSNNNRSLPEELYPQHYSNRSLGRVIDGIFTNGAHVYESQYKRHREHLEDLKKQEPDLFKSCVNHIVSGKDMSKSDKEKVDSFFKSRDTSIELEIIARIMRDWKEHSPTMSSSYWPEFMLDAGTPVSRSYYEQIAADINRIREENPEFADEISSLIRYGKPTDIINADNWYKEKYPEKKDGISKLFSRAVSCLRGIDRNVAKTYMDIAFTPENS